MTSETRIAFVIQCQDILSNFFNEKSQPRVLTLNDDCLRHIFSYLPVRDRIRVQRVCKRWQTVSLLPWQDLKKLELGYKLFANGKEPVRNPVQAISHVMRMCGRYVTSIDAGSEYDFMMSSEFFKFLTNICPHIQSYDMRFITLTSQAIKTIADSQADITDIAIGPCFMKCEEEINELFLKKRHLRSVSLCKSNVTGQCLASLNPQTVERLVLDNLPDISKTFVLNAIQNFNKLQVLELYSNSSPKLIREVDDVLRSIPVKSSLTILKLTLSTQENFPIPINNIANLINLSEISLGGKSFVNSQTLCTLATYCENLKRLSLSDSDQFISFGRQNFKSTLNLEELRVSGLSQLTEQSFESINMPFLKILKCYNCYSLDFHTFGRLVERQSYLQRLDVINCGAGTFGYDDALIDSVIIALRKSEKTLEMHVLSQKNILEIHRMPPLILMKDKDYCRW